MLKRVLLSLVLAAIVFTCSGCATILGGIIGYQSGELAAGLAIGAAIDFGDDIARGIGQMTAKEKDLQQDFRKKSTFNTNTGEITLPINPFNRQRIMNISDQLRNKFEENNWTCERAEKTVCTPFLGPTRWQEKWSCTTENGDSFVFQICFHSSRNTKFQICQVSEHSPQPGPNEENAPSTPPADSPPQDAKAVITGQIYQWIEQIVTGSQVR